MDEFEHLYKYLLIWDKLFQNFKAADSSRDMELDQEEFIEFASGLGMRNKKLVSKVFEKVDAD